MLISKDSNLAPLSDSMTKWEYMVVSISEATSRAGGYVGINGEALAHDSREKKDWMRNRHKMLNEVGSEGWELIKIRGTNGNETLYFKRPL